MMLRRSAVALTRRSVFTASTRRAFTAGVVRRDSTPKHSAAPSSTPAKSGKPNMEKRIEEIEDEHDLIPEGALPGTVPTDAEQATGLERLEILGKMQGIDIFDMKPLPSDRLGTVKDPIMVRSFGDEQYCGCTGVPADSHHVKWLTITRDRPLGRCTECGSCYLMEYVGPEHVHEAERTEPIPKTFADYIKPEYYYR